jgi:UDP-GlcNAc:undecaprenyl-phosphate GlcNAc-1-phosphate transferase
VLTPLVRGLAVRRGLLDRPDGRRKAHPTPVPRLGGLAVYASFLAASGVVLALVQDTTAFGPAFREAFLHLAVAGTAVVLIGLADDLHGVKPAAKLLVQGLAALYLYGNGYRVGLLSNPFGERFDLGLLSLPITLLWFIGASNAFNLIDGLDGLAAGIGLFATATVFVTALINDSWETSLLAAALGGALIGFLRYNLSPASIFLGDGARCSSASCWPPSGCAAR